MRDFSGQAIEHIVQEYSPNLYRFALAYLKNHAESQDVVQEVLIQLIQKRPVFSAEAQEKAWLYKATANRCKNILKSGRYKREAPMTEDIHDMEAPEQADGQTVLNDVLSLEEKYRIPVHLYYYEGYSVKEIAKLTGTTPSTVSTHLDRARRKLKGIIGEES